MKKINSVNKVRQWNDGNMYYVSREILQFNNKSDSFIAVYKETIFDIVDDNGNKYIKIIDNKLPQMSAEFSFEQVDALFKLIGKPINLVDNFVECFEELQTQAMLIDTKTQRVNGRYGTTEWVKYDEAELLKAIG